MSWSERTSGALKKSAVSDALILCAGAIILAAISHALDLAERFNAFMYLHEEWELDEFVFVMNIVGIAGFIYAWRRVLDMREQMRLRDKAEGRAAWIARHDSLTGLPNRHYLEEFCADPDRRRSIAFAAAIDLDGFKKVNDLLGHHGGDELLCMIASRLANACPKAEIIRMGGDEFVILLERAPTDLMAFGVSLARELSQPANVSGFQVEVGASIGLAVTEKSDASLNDVVRRADTAMYVAKRRGRNAVSLFEPHMADLLIKRAETELALRKAVEDESIVPHYQPLMDLSTGKVCGFEALARWTDDSGKSIPPSEFIELAEDMGLIVDLSEQILRRACQDARKWPSHLMLSFNLSPTQLNDHLLGLRVVQILGETGLPPHRLEIEITESALVSEPEAAKSIIEDLHLAGIRVALDDFGTGYSSLAQLSHYEFDKIKIDRGFISTFRDNEKQMKIVKAIVGLGKGLNIQTTAEGIEDQDQLDTLKSIGCDMGQGFLFAKAMTPEQVADFLQVGDKPNIAQTA
ncbi:putative bifunctional diguanylate cyclase/phosphodiesterase [Tepidamorphus sp. 3E244]|uniref:putative bifunctional diguanylate cyclase/phosphodiesterase n=1 Tax=Tepidamorphus sp. 3E244 TaxID=3385498 RepID=UPI0038FC1DEF